MAPSRAGLPSTKFKGISARWNSCRKWFNNQPITIRASIIGGILAGVIPSVILAGIALAGLLANSINPKDDITTASVSNLASADSPILTDEFGLQLVDAAFLAPSPGSEFGPSQVDVKLRNISDQVAFLKRADVKVEKVWRLEWIPGNFAGELPTWNYDIALPRSGEPFTTTFNISQSIDPNAVDRFTLTIGSEGAIETSVLYVYQLTIDLIYDEDDKVVSTGQMLITSASVGPSWLTNCEMFDSQSKEYGDTCRDLKSSSLELLNEINAVEAVRSPVLITALKENNITATSWSILNL